MALMRILNNPSSGTVYIWDTQKKRWLLTPDVSVPVLESFPPEGGQAAKNIYKDTSSGQVVFEFENDV